MSRCREMMIIFVYDTLASENSHDPASAVLYFHPSWVSDQQKTSLCGQIIGTAHCLKSVFGRPKILALQSGKFCISDYGQHVLVRLRSRRFPHDGNRFCVEGGRHRSQHRRLGFGVPGEHPVFLHQVFPQELGVHVEVVRQRGQLSYQVVLHVRNVLEGVDVRGEYVLQHSVDTVTEGKITFCCSCS